MEAAKFFNEFAKQCSDSLPPPLKALRSEFEKQLHEGLKLAFSKFSLVTREEFDIQTEVLVRTRDKLLLLERKLAQLEIELAAEQR